MSSAELDLTSPIQFLKGVGPKRARALKEVGVETVEDFLLYVPRRYVDRSLLTPINRLQVNSTATILARVESIREERGRRPRLVVILRDGTGFVECVWFQGYKYIKGLLERGKMVMASGSVRFFGGLQMPHPEFEVLEGGEEELIHTGRIIPIYPSTAGLKAIGLSNRYLRSLIKVLLDSFLPKVEEMLPQEVIQRHSLLSRQEAIGNLHFPTSWELTKKARERLAFEEFFVWELVMALRKRKRAEEKGLGFKKPSNLVRSFIHDLSFDLTSAQKRVLREIYEDVSSGKPMHRLVQGDVGSGKTVVAFICLLWTVENGYQGVLMAPTEILAEQHYLSLRGLLGPIEVETSLLVSGIPKARKEEIRERIGKGETKVVIGTHALIEEGVSFRNLGLAVIDEQHKFGVVQRASLRGKGSSPHLLVMTATPIPRSLALTVYGDLDISILDEFPPGRRRVKTGWRDERARGKVYSFLRDKIREGRQAYVICPLVEESEKLDLKAATKMAEHLGREVFPDLKVELLHGRMGGEAKEEIMGRFRRGEIDILVSTTVVEVGADVPNAAIILVEHAERYGLSQLHQMRGRVGRGEHQSYCILLVSYPLSSEAKERIETICGTNDGFRIAEADLRLRGPGEFMGTKQHGLPQFKVADLAADGPLLRKAREEAFDLASRDQVLREPYKGILLRRFREGGELLGAG